MIYFMLFLIFILNIVILCLCISTLRTSDDILSFNVEMADVWKRQPKRRKK